MPEHVSSGIVPRPASPLNSLYPTNRLEDNRYRPTDPAQVADGLLVYLKKQARTAAVSFAERPLSIPNGWETYTYHFRLQGPVGMDLLDNRPLILRIFSGPCGVPRVRHEFAVQRYLHRAGYPVPEPFLLEEGCELFGGPFLIMEQVLGRTFLEDVSENPLRLWGTPWELAALHARLHALPTDGFPAPPGPFLERRLDEIRALIRDHDLRGLLPGWRWLVANKPEPPASPRILHLDFHPLNVMRGPDRSLTVLDWTEADVGDLHADVATSLMLMKCCAMPEASGWRRRLLPVGRFFLWRRYYRGYKKWSALDRRKLSYYGALAALRRLCGYGRWLRASPLATGCKASSIKHLRPDHLRTFRDYFQARTGVVVHL